VKLRNAAKGLMTALLAGALVCTAPNKAYAQTPDKTVTGIIQVWPDNVPAAGRTIHIYSTVEGGNQRKRNVVTNPDGTYSTNIPTAITQHDNNIPEGYVLSNPYPNPFNPATKIDFEIPKNTHVNIDVYNILGQQVKNILDKELNTGHYTVDIDLDGLANGVYFLRMQTDEFSETKKLALVYGTQHASRSTTRQNSIKNNIEKPAQSVNMSIDSLVIPAQANLRRTAYHNLGTFLEDTIRLGTKKAYVIGMLETEGKIWALLDYLQNHTIPENGIPGVQLIIKNADSTYRDTTTTSPTGDYTIGLEDTTLHHFKIIQLGYWTREGPIKITQDTTAHLNIIDTTRFNSEEMNFLDRIHRILGIPEELRTFPWNNPTMYHELTGQLRTVFEKNIYFNFDTTETVARQRYKQIRNLLHTKMLPEFITPKYPTGYFNDWPEEVGNNPITYYYGKPGWISIEMGTPPAGWWGTSAVYTDLGTEQTYSATATYLNTLDSLQLAFPICHELQTCMTAGFARDSPNNNLISVLDNPLPWSQIYPMPLDYKCALIIYGRPPGNRFPDRNIYNQYTGLNKNMQGIMLTYSALTAEGKSYSTQVIGTYTEKPEQLLSKAQTQLEQIIREQEQR